MDAGASGTEPRSTRAGRGVDTDPRDLHARQVLFVCSLTKLFDYAFSRGYELTLGEGFVQSSRLARSGVVVEDGVHMVDSLHYERLALDVNLFVRGTYVRASDHFAWIDLGAFWEALDPLCRWGGRFAKRDANHVSVAWMGRA